MDKKMHYMFPFVFRSPFELSQVTAWKRLTTDYICIYIYIYNV